jgi:hypothetical protein
LKTCMEFVSLISDPSGKLMNKNNAC